MLDCFVAEQSDLATTPISVVKATDVATWQKNQPAVTQAWLESTGFRAKARMNALIPGADGKLAGAVMVGNDPLELWDFAGLGQALPKGDWRLPDDLERSARGRAILGWALAAYQFNRYKKREADGPRRLVIGQDDQSREAQILAEAIYLGRDLVNTPANDMGPAELEAAGREVAGRFGANVTNDRGRRTSR